MIETRTTTTPFKIRPRQQALQLGFQAINFHPSGFKLPLPPQDRFSMPLKTQVKSGALAGKEYGVVLEGTAVGREPSKGADSSAEEFTRSLRQLEMPRAELRPHQPLLRIRTD